MARSALVLAVAVSVALILSISLTATWQWTTSGCTLLRDDATMGIRPEPRVQATLEALRRDVAALKTKMDQMTQLTAARTNSTIGASYVHRVALPDPGTEAKQASDAPPPSSAAPESSAYPFGGMWKQHALPPHIARDASWFERERTLNDVFRDTASGQVVWLTFTNLAFVELAINWAAHVYRLRKERHMAIAALDAQVKSVLLAEMLPCLDAGVDDGVEEDVRSNNGAFRNLGFQKVTLVLQVLKAGRHVLISDVDVAWLKDPEHYFATSIPSADVGSSTDCLFLSADQDKNDRERSPYLCEFSPGNAVQTSLVSPGYNTGIMFFRASVAARMVALAWSLKLKSLQVHEDNHIDDQLAFNKLSETKRDPNPRA